MSATTPDLGSADVDVDTRATAQVIPQPTARPQDAAPSSTPLEMSSLPANFPLTDPTAAIVPATKTASADSSSPSHHGPVRMDTNTAIDQSLHPPPPPPPTDGPTDPHKVTRTFSTAIGPSSDSPVVPAKDGESGGPALTVTLLLTSGARHPFRLDSKYFAKRGVDVADNDPFNLSVYKLKELILREWREEWEAKPTSPNYIRLISMGKLLDDKSSLQDYKLAVDSPNVLHMTIKPQDYVEDEDAKGGKSTFSHNRDADGRSPGCRCTVM